MIHLMFFALFGALHAQVGADPAQLFRFFAAQAQQRSRGSAYRGTFHVQADTIRHHGHIIFQGTGRRTMMTGTRAGEAGIYT